ncbi:Zinc finger protein 3 [Cardamine amara subsp. amara]|uniref:Zinc finger protein 3 n=1 Tax=Cardamine amara subsp. amara TaxID=228776 RepID=A0ABD1AKZ4_CARAN
MSSSSSSTPKPEILQSLIEAMKESSEKEMIRNTNLTLGSPQEVTSERRVEIPSFRSGPVRRGSEIMKFYPSKSNKIYSCHFCKKGFSTLNPLGGHQNVHKQEREWDKKRKEMEADFPRVTFLNPYLDKPHILLGGYSKNVLSNENHLGITLKPFKRQVNPYFNSGVTGGNAGMNMAVVPRLTPTRFFTGNTSTHGSASMAPGPFPSNNNMHPFIHRNVFPFPPPRTSRDLVPQENVLTAENLISMIGKNSVVEIDDDDDDDEQQEKGTYKSEGIDLSLSL